MKFKTRKYATLYAKLEAIRYQHMYEFKAIKSRYRNMELDHWVSCWTVVTIH